MRLYTLTLAFSLFLGASLQAQTLSKVDHTANAGKVEWQPRQIYMEDLKEGEPVTKEFTVKNISKEDLLLLEVKPSCTCTSVAFDRTPVAPGASTVIKVTYDAAKSGDFYRIVTVVTNFDPNQSVALVINGNVLPKPPTPEENTHE